MNEQDQRSSTRTVVGIDVGGKRKGFHAVALHGGQFVLKRTDLDPTQIVAWSLQQEAKVIAVDAPCRWSLTGSSRRAERCLAIKGIRCFATPMRTRAEARNFYQWMLNGEILYEELAAHYTLFDGTRIVGPICIETFPHAIVCAMAERVVSSKRKAEVRRAALQRRGYDTRNLPNIDFIDAALCAVTAEEFRKGCYQCYGDCDEGYIVVPKN
jgi:predicted nuclease with RNAse H fold